MIKYLTIALLALTPLSNLDAKTRPSFSRSSGSRVSSFSSKPSGFSSNASKPSTVKPSPTAPKNAFDKSQAARSIKPPTPPKPKEQYVSDFKKNNESKYPTKFTTPPASRPSYIPPTTAYNGQQREIYYNQSAGGYGFMNTLGQFMIYDAITDIALGSFQKDQTVYVQQTKEHEAAIKAQEAEQENSSFIFFAVFLIISLLALFFYWILKA